MTTPGTVQLPKASELHRLAIECGVRKLYTAVEETRAENGAGVATPILQAAAVAVIKNPWVGTSTDTDLQPETKRIAPIISKLLSDRLLAALGGEDASADSVEAFGKAAVVGIAGEMEHAGALIHTPTSGTSCASFSTARRSSASRMSVPRLAATCGCRCGTSRTRRPAATTRA